MSFKDVIPVYNKIWTFSDPRQVAYVWGKKESRSRWQTSKRQGGVLDIWRFTEHQILQVIHRDPARILQYPFQKVQLYLQLDLSQEDVWIGKFFLELNFAVNDVKGGYRKIVGKVVRSVLCDMYMNDILREIGMWSGRL